MVRDTGSVPDSALLVLAANIIVMVVAAVGLYEIEHRRYMRRLAVDRAAQDEADRVRAEARAAAGR